MIGVLEWPGGVRVWGMLQSGETPRSREFPAAPSETSGAPSRVTLDQEERALAREVHRRPERFEILYARYYDRILNFCYRRVRERSLAEDLTSQIFLSAMEYLTRNARDVHFRPWLYRVATNAWLSHERARSRRAERWMSELHRWMHAAPTAVPADALARGERLELVRGALMALAVRYREPILLKYDEELSDAEIGLALGLTPAGVRSRLSRGLALLRRRVRSL